MLCEMSKESARESKLKPWRPPFKWPPSEWRLPEILHDAADFAAVTVVVMLILTVIGGLIVWGGLLYQAVHLVFQANTHEALRNLLLGLAAVLGAPFVIWRTLIAAQQTAINRESHYTDLFTKAVEQLAADKLVKRREFRPRFKRDKNSDEFLRDKDGEPVPAVRPDGTPLGDWETVEVIKINREVRLGAIYALERIAQDSERDHWPIMETLTAYVRNNADTPMGRDKFVESMEEDKRKAAIGSLGLDPSYWVKKLPSPRVDIQAAIRVIGRRAQTRIAYERDESRNYQLDVRKSNLQKADLAAMNFDYARFEHATLEGADFSVSSLVYAKFMWSKLNNASFAQADGEHAFFDEADLETASFTQGHFPFSSFIGANLRRGALRDSYLEQANFEGADLSVRPGTL